MNANANVDVICRMTQAAIDGDRPGLDACMTPDLAFHVRGPVPRAGDHTGVDGFLDVIGHLFEVTSGDVKLERKFALAEGEWAAEWEHAVLGRDGRTLESNNSFVYRFEGGRIAEMWMLWDASAEDGRAFFA
jgi:ketosteroid isomerase-like protein